MNLGENIRSVRKQKKLTQEQLADKIGVKRSVVSKYENDCVKISVETLDKIAMALGVEPLKLAYGIDDKQALRYVIPDIPPSNNKFIGRENRFEYQNYKKSWAELVKLFCRPKPAKPIKKSIVKLTYYFKDNRRRDPDNYSGKMLLDPLVKNEIIEDDTFKNITLKLSAEVMPKVRRTFIQVIEVESEDNQGAS